MPARSKRELIEPHPGDKRYVRRNAKGQITDSDDASKSLSRDVKTAAKRTTKTAGQGDQGDRRRGKSS